jgi:thiol-disulfide isomerase/thioredoxin
MNHLVERRNALILMAGCLVAGTGIASLTWLSHTSINTLSLPTSIPAISSAGDLAPDASLHMLSGSTLSLHDLRGKLVAMNFWATWCVPCRSEMPELEQASQHYQDVGLVIVAVNVGESARTVQAFVSELGLDHLQVALDFDAAIADQYGVIGFPTTFWIDRNGFIQAKHIGPLTRDQIDHYMQDILQATSGIIR